MGTGSVRSRDERVHRKKLFININDYLRMGERAEWKDNKRTFLKPQKGFKNSSLFCLCEISFMLGMKNNFFSHSFERFR